MQVSIDADKCQGHGRCVLSAPDVFDVDDDGLGRVIVAGIRPEMEDEVRSAVVSCPESAITIS